MMKQKDESSYSLKRSRQSMDKSSEKSQEESGDSIDKN